MGIMTRLLRICKADINGIMDQLEDKPLLLKQYLRDMEEDLDKKEAELKNIVASHEQAQRDYQRCAGECEKLDQDIATAIEKDKDDIARSLIKKLKPLAYHCNELDRHIHTLEVETGQLRQCVEEQRLQYEHLQPKSREYFQRFEREEREKTTSSILPFGGPGEVSEAEVELELLKRKQSQGG
jgi:phage shock protein A